MKISQKVHGHIQHDAPKDQLKTWEFPSVEPPITEQDAEKTNALGLKPQWRYEPPDETVVEEIKPLTAEEIEQIRQQAYEEGFTEGKEEGYQVGFTQGKEEGFEQGKQQGLETGIEQGLAQGQEQIEQLTARWQQLIEQLTKPLDIVEQQVEQQLVQLSTMLAEAIVEHEIAHNPDSLIHAISAAVKALPLSESTVQILLHPDDIKLINSTLGDSFIQESGWQLLPSPELNPGDCVVENTTSQIDLRLKSRIKKVITPFLQQANQ
jgi:flagellar assembly protein FliH